MASRTDILKRYGITDRTELRVWTSKQGLHTAVVVNGINDHGIGGPDYWAFLPHEQRNYQLNFAK